MKKQSVEDIVRSTKKYFRMDVPFVDRVVIQDAIQKRFNIGYGFDLRSTDVNKRWYIFNKYGYFHVKSDGTLVLSGKIGGK